MARMNLDWKHWGYIATIAPGEARYFQLVDTEDVDDDDFVIERVLAWTGMVAREDPDPQGMNLEIVEGLLVAPYDEVGAYAGPEFTGMNTTAMMIYPWMWMRFRSAGALTQAVFALEDEAWNGYAHPYWTHVDNRVNRKVEQGATLWYVIRNAIDSSADLSFRLLAKVLTKHS